MIHTSRDDRAPELSNQTIGTRIEQPKLLIICRDNGLYGEASMHSSIALLHRGYKVSWLALPAELDGELLKCSVHDAMASERPDAVVCDYTVDGVLSERGVRPLAILDEAFSWATGSALAKFFNLSGWGSGNPELEIKERLKGLLNPGYLRKCGEPVTALL
ncbi:MAG: hypothetical protein J5J00_13045, partial [Deltaproteobacteria bacterium]|nr:hypothetical protein [Deltaproteobacteria bacterium]